MSYFSTVKLCECGCGQETSRRFAHGHYLGNGRVPCEEWPDQLCGCGCGETTPRAAKTRRGYRKGQPLRFIRGHYSRTPAASPPPVRFGEDNNQWTANAVVETVADKAYRVIHARLIRWYPKAGVCQLCDGEGIKTDYALIHGRTYSSDRSDYLELCRRCHNRYDRPWDGLAHDPATGRWVRKEVVNGEDHVGK